jgi:2-methylcitrate dehydratase
MRYPFLQSRLVLASPSRLRQILRRKVEEERMTEKTMVEKLADFVHKARYEDLSDEAVHALKIRTLDALGCALGSLGHSTMHRLKSCLEELEEEGACTLIGGGSAPPDRAAFYNSALVRYLDYNDSYLAPGETCHPSDNLGGVLTASEYRDGSGKDFLTSLAVSYQVQCRLSDEAPVRARGFDHTTQGSYAAAAGVSKALGLDPEQTANALAMSGTAFNALRVTRTGALSNWKGLAYPNTVLCCTHAAFLAKHGITGPREVFEGNKGFMDSIAGEFEIDWGHEGLEKVRDTAIKKYNAEVHSQSTLEGVLELREEHGLDPREIERVEIETFDVAFHIIGGGEEGDKRVVRSKEEADHSLPYLVSVALLDGRVLPEQFFEERVSGQDVQELLRKVQVRQSADLSRRFPESMPCRIAIHLVDGSVLRREKTEYEGYPTNPVSWETAVRKFRNLAGPHLATPATGEIVNAVHTLESIDIRGLTDLLGKVQEHKAVFE